MTHATWKISASIVALVLIALLALRLTRRVPHFEPPGRDIQGEWGTLDAMRAEKLQHILDEHVNSLGVPGLQAFALASDQRTWSGTSGTVDLARKIPLRRDHILRVGSTTKTFMATIILQLVDEGSLSLDDALSRWFPDFPKAGKITVRQLLEHTSGIPEFLQSSEVIMKSILPTQQWKPEEVIAVALKSQPGFAPGEGWSYSNTNYVLLGLIAERVSGRTSAELMRERIIDPLGLKNTHFVPYEPAPQMLVTGYDRDLSRFPGMLDIAPNNTSWATAAFTSGALASNADDLGEFYRRLFEGELLSPAALEQMTTFVRADNPGFEEQDGYGLGLMRISAGGQEYVGHVGEFMGSTAIAMYAPAARELMVVTTNLSYPNLIEVLVGLQKVLE